MGGAVTGFAKAFKRENPDALVKAVDVADGASPEAVAGCSWTRPCATRVPSRSATAAASAGPWRCARFHSATPAGIELGPDTVFAITGAAGSIVAAITADLARASQGTFHLLDLVPQPDAADPDIGAFASDKENLKRTIFERLKAAGERATPALVDKELARIERARSALGALQAIEAAGGRVHYHSVDLRDGEAVEAVIHAHPRDQRPRRRRSSTPPASRSAAAWPTRRPRSTTSSSTSRPTAGSTSSMGSAIDPLGAAVVFSSVAGRFGNAGQTDYSAANDLLCKEISSLQRTRPGTLGIAIDWTAWADIGMATRGSIPTAMKVGRHRHAARPRRHPDRAP